MNPVGVGETEGVGEADVFGVLVGTGDGVGLGVVGVVVGVGVGVAVTTGLGVGVAVGDVVGVGETTGRGRTFTPRFQTKPFFVFIQVNNFPLLS